MLLCFTALLITLCSAQNQLEYSVKGCSDTRFTVSGYEYSNNSLIVYIMRNCCSDEIVVKKDESMYKIIEKDNDGKICKCNCMAEVEIKNADKNAKVVFVDYTGNEKTLKNLHGEFCGWSTYAECKSDVDCTTGGCSGQVCMGVGEDVVTTCEWKDCFDAKKFNMKCGCFENKCQWAQS